MQNHFLFLLADGFEETEMVVPFDILLRGGVKVSLASIRKELNVKGAHGLLVKADVLLSDVDISLFSGVFLPGGGLGVENLRASEAVLDAVKGLDIPVMYNVQSGHGFPMITIPMGAMCEMDTERRSIKWTRR